MNKEQLEQLLKTTFENITTISLNQLYQYYQMLEESSKVMNLTTITKLEDVYIKHFYDSLLLSKVVDLNQDLTLADIGTGAGFPGLVLKIVYPHLDITLIEPTTKRCNFLNKVIDSLNLKKIQVLNERAENLSENYRNSFDIVTARAVAGLNILSELCVPFVKVNGLFIALKGSSYETELVNNQNAEQKLKIKLNQIRSFDLPNDLGKRTLLTYFKKEKTPNIYPRIYPKIKKNPL